jgi:hypothetical protein
VTDRLVTAASRLLSRRTSRGGFLTRVAVAGSAVAVGPLRYLLRPTSALGIVTCADCGPGAACCDGWTAFCCTIAGSNSCPSYTFIGGWWKCTDYVGSNLCSVEGVRYYIDCNRLPARSCPAGCSCANGECDHRHTCCNVFRYGQCNTQVGTITEVVCRADLQRDLHARGSVPAHPRVRGARRGGGGDPVTLLVTAEAVVLALLVLLVAGLLRSHAEILRRLEAIDAAPQRAAQPGDAPGILDPDLPAPGGRATVAHDIAGQTLAGGALQIAPSTPGRPTLLAFLTSGCTVCGGFWKTFSSERRPQLPDGGRRVVLAAGDVPVLLSTAAWADYAVPGAPYFVFVDGRGQVAGEGSAREWSQVASLLADAVADADAGHRDRGRRVEEELAAAGLRAGDPSLWSQP